MFQRIEGELLKVVRVENGWVVYVWDPEAPKPTLPIPGQTQPPCQQPVRWWKPYIFPSVAEVNVFISTFLESTNGG